MKLDTWMIKVAISLKKMFVLWLQKSYENIKKDLNVFYMEIEPIQKYI